MNTRWAVIGISVFCFACSETLVDANGESVDFDNSNTNTNTNNNGNNNNNNNNNNSGDDLALLSWQAPTQNTDTSPLEDLSGFEIHYGTTSASDPGFVQYDVSLSVAASDVCVGTDCEYSLSADLDPATYYFAINAYDLSGNNSDFSNEASKTF